MLESLLRIWIQKDMKERKGGNVGLFQAGAGNILASMVLSGFFIGYFIDKWLDKAPLFMLGLGFLGLLGGAKKVHIMLKHENKESRNSDNNGSGN